MSDQDLNLSEASDTTAADTDFDALLQAELHAALEQERAESASSDEDAGPRDLGELTDEVDGAEEDPEDDELEEELDDEGDDDSDEEDDEDEEESEESDEEEKKEPEPEASKELSALREELAELRRERDEERAARKELMTLLTRQQEPAGGNRELPADKEFQAAWEAAFLNNADEFKRFSPAVQKRVRDLSERYQRDQARYALNPEAELFEKFGPTLQRIFDRELGPLRKFVEQVQHKEATQPFREELADENVKARVIEILAQDIPGHEVKDPAFQRQRLKAALKQYKLEQAASKTSKREQKLKTRERQAEAKKRSARKGSSKGKRRQKKRRAAPKLDNPEDMKSYAQLLASDPELLRELEEQE